jgi:hypothetical protein
MLTAFPLERRKQSAHSYLTLHVEDRPGNDLLVASSSSDFFGFGDEADSTIQALRSEMVDIVYQLSPECLNGFDNQWECKLQSIRSSPCKGADQQGYRSSRGRVE